MSWFWIQPVGIQGEVAVWAQSPEGWRRARQLALVEIWYPFARYPCLVRYIKLVSSGERLDSEELSKRVRANAVYWFRAFSPSPSGRRNSANVLVLLGPDKNASGAALSHRMYHIKWTKPSPLSHYDLEVEPFLELPEWALARSYIPPESNRQILDPFTGEVRILPKEGGL